MTVSTNNLERQKFDADTFSLDLVIWNVEIMGEHKLLRSISINLSVAEYYSLQPNGILIDSLLNFVKNQNVKSTLETIYGRNMKPLTFYLQREPILFTKIGDPRIPKEIAEEVSVVGVA